MSKNRLDIILIERSLVRNREEASRLIRAGKVLVKEVVTDKPGAKIESDAPIRVIRRDSVYVSRGGLKLAEALKRFAVDVREWTAADLGASTGGFTDCLLQHGARKVFAIDVGYGQLDYRLQQDARVRVMDRTNCRYLDEADLGERVDLVAADLSFISLTTVFSAVTRIVKKDGQAIFLIKPQFEIGKGRVGKRGIVKQFDDHVDVLEQCRNFFDAAGWIVADIAPSPIQGKSGNIEFLIHLVQDRNIVSIGPERIHAIAQEAHVARSTQ
ncbi:MAG: TlyA family RNA methyltransferase [Candidatus Omnitrophota bacterium]|jgi:23S rRNA (cytidine1920-2'-O)/16S rRNA (cytidine1409-2'-O)-methyltransferase|nr:MAG: TlyA family RNA methyltransferase [Candidatus Omnitrophota bacterium]